MRKERSFGVRDLRERSGRVGLGTLAATLLFLGTLQTAHAQLGVTTFGIQLKPVIPFGFFEPITTLEQGTLASTVELKGGLAFGMVVRTGLTKAISLEVGIDQITRRYDVALSNDTNDYHGSTQIRFVGYELPVTCLVYIRLGEKTWMNNALGLSMDFYPSDAVRNFDSGQVYYYRRNWAQLGIVGNIGVEYRTERSGYFYLGGTFHRPFQDLALAEVTWADQYQNYRPYRMSKFLSGSYLTVDLRYFFHEDPDKARLRKARSK
ncbi:MAG: hypothetical protein IPN44_02980 [Flavobacteriales bacterium]|nr:hypothetical protein [Flavobacteriales bacterium]